MSDQSIVGTQAPSSWAAYCDKQRAYARDAYQLREDMNNRPTAKPSLMRRTEDVLARAQRATSRDALTKYYQSGRSQARQAEAEGKSLWMSVALVQSYAASGARASRAIGAWLALTAPLDFMVGQSRLVGEEREQNAGLVATGGCSPFSLLQGTAALVGAPIGAAVFGALEATSAMSKGADRKQWSKAMRKGALWGSVFGGFIAGKMTKGALAWGQLGAQASVFLLKTAVAVVGATLGVLIGLPFGAVRVLTMAYAEAQRSRQMRAESRACERACAPPASVSSFHTARDAFSDMHDDDDASLQLGAMASAG